MVGSSIVQYFVPVRVFVKDRSAQRRPCAVPTISIQDARPNGGTARTRSRPMALPTLRTSPPLPTRGKSAETFWRFIAFHVPRSFTNPPRESTRIAPRKIARNLFAFSLPQDSSVELMLRTVCSKRPALKRLTGLRISCRTVWRSCRVLRASGS
jgi:hypothetical protein